MGSMRNYKFMILANDNTELSKAMDVQGYSHVGEIFRWTTGFYRRWVYIQAQNQDVARNAIRNTLGDLYQADIHSPKVA